MFLSKPKYSFSLSLIFIIATFFACSDKEITLLNKKEVSVVQKLCYLKDADHGHGIIYNLSYNAQNQLMSFTGFPDFNQINYEKNLPTKVFSSFDELFYIAYEYDTNGNLTLINFLVKDSPDKTFEFKSKVYNNTNKQIEKVDLLMPMFDEVLTTKFEYDANSNIKKMFLVKNGKDKLVLENMGFDDKKSPYINTPLNNLMMYFTIFSATIGGENTTYFQNKNNATSTKIYADNGDMTFTYIYEYTPDGYASKVKVTKKQTGKEETHEENYTYTCK
ncbi:MAG: hypothetical protein ACK4YV_09005 [Emticicia sp.]